MENIATYVFLDLETTGLPQNECNKTRITELSMVAVKRKHILDGLPRVKHKLTLCFNPGRMIDPVSTQLTGLCNDLLEFESNFNKETVKTINSFLNLLKEPVCLIAHNGGRFDFPILKNHLEKLKEGFPKEMLCADSWFCFYDILEPSGYNSVTQGVTETEASGSVTEIRKNLCCKCGENIDEPDQSASGNLNEQRLMQLANESTPKGRKRKICLSTSRPMKAKRKLPWGINKPPKDSYKLEEVYTRIVGPITTSAHQAENDCIMALEIAVVLKDKFVKWVDENCQLFLHCKPMTIGISL